MKVDRLIIIEDAQTGRHVAARDSMFDAAAAMQGIPEHSVKLQKLMDGQTVKFDFTVSGLRFHGMDIPNRQGMERLKRERQRV